MANPNPYHVRLAISQYGDQFRAELFTEDLGDTEGKELFPSLRKLRVGEQEIDVWLNSLAGGHVTFNAEEVRNIGKLLFDQLLGKGENLKKWQEICAQAEKQGRAIRLLIDAATPDVYDLPYGLVCAQDDKFLFQPESDRRAIQFVRILRQSTPRLLQLSRKPLRVLVVAAEPKGLEVGCANYLCQFLQGVAEERYAVTLCDVAGAYPLREAVSGAPDAWQPAQFTRFCRTTKAVLKQTLQGGDYDLLHVIAHGVGSGLLLCTADGAREEVSSGDFGNWCRASRLQLAFLQVCKSGEAGERGAFGGIAQKLVSPQFGNLAAVVASPYPIDPAQSTQVAIRFYQQLACADSPSPDVALLHSFPTDEGDWRLWALLELWVRPRALESTGTRGFFQFPSPYRGLARFEERDAEIFFGREAETAELLHILATDPVVAVVGDSGSGKSSLLQAGVCAWVRQYGARFSLTKQSLEQLKNAGMPEQILEGLRCLENQAFISAEASVNAVKEHIGHEQTVRYQELIVKYVQHGLLNRTDWRIVSLTPGATPAQNLLAAFGASPDGSPREETLRQMFVQVWQTEQPLLLVFDQFEELFTLCADPAERRAVSVVLAEEVRQHPDRFRLILGMRSEYLGAAAALPGLNELITRPWVLKFPDANNVRAIVAEPARYHGYTFERDERRAEEDFKDLLDRILNDPLLTTSAADAKNQTTAAPLPLLEFALERLWLKAVERGSQEFTHADYEAIGGLTGAIARHADEVYDYLPTRFPETGPASQRVAETILTELVTTNTSTGETKHTRRPRPRMELETETDAPELTHKVIDRLVGERLLTLRGNPNNPDDAQVDLAHEVLIGWDKLQQWLALDPAGREMKRAFQDGLKRWDQQLGETPARSLQLLPKDEVAAEYIAWIDRKNPTLPAPEQQAFIAALRNLLRRKKEAEAEQRRKEEEQQQKELKAARTLAEEQQKLAKEAEARRAAEEHARQEAEQRAEAEQQRAKAEAQARKDADDHVAEQTIANRRLRRRAIGLFVVFCIAAVAALYAGKKTWETSDANYDAKSNAWIATKKEQVAEKRRAEAEQAKKEADRRAWISASQRFAAESQLVRAEYPQRSLLLSVEAINMMMTHGESYPSSAEQALRDALAYAGGIALTGGSALAFSPDNRRLATSSQDGAVRLWDLTAPDVTASAVVLRGHKHNVTAMTFSPDSRRLITNDGMVRLWDLTAPDVAVSVVVLCGHEDNVAAMAFSLDGRRLVTNDGTVRLWDLTAPDVAASAVVLIEQANLWGAIALSPDGRRLVTGGADASVRLWDLTAPDVAKSVVVLRGHEQPVRAVAFSPDGRRIITNDGTVRLWDLTARNVTTSAVELRGDSGSIAEVAFSPDGQRLVGSIDSTVWLWDLTAPDVAKSVVVLRGHEQRVLAGAFSPDSRYLVTSSDDKTVRLWDLTAPDVAASAVVLRGYENAVQAVAFSPDGRRLVTGSADDTARLWSLAATDVAMSELVLHGHKNPVRRVAFSSDGRWLVTESVFEPVCLWDLTAPDVTASVVVLRGQHDELWGVTFSPDSRRLVVGDGNMVRLWDVVSPDVAASALVLRGHEEKVNAMAFSPDSQRLVSGSQDGTVRLWDLTKLNIEASSLVLGRHDEKITSIAISPDGRRLVTGSGDNTARLWDLTVPDVAASVVELRGHGAEVTAVAFSSDSRRLVTGSADTTARLWDLTVPDVAASAIELRGHGDAVTAVIFSDDGRWLATGSKDKAARLWNLTVPDVAASAVVLRGHGDAVRAVAFSPDSRRLVTGSDDATGSQVRLWDLTVPDVAASAVVLRGHRDAVRAVAFSPDSQRLATGSIDNTVRLWDVPIEPLLRRACQTAGRNLSLTEWEQYFRGEIYRQSCVNQPVHPSVLEAAQKLAKAGNMDVARAIFQHVRELDPNVTLDPTTEANTWRAKGYMEEGQQSIKEKNIDRALANFKNALEFDPGVKIELINVGRNAAKDGNIDAAKVIFQRVLEFDPSIKINPLTEAKKWELIGEGVRLAKQGSIKDALSAYTEAQTLDPTRHISAHYWDMLCWYGSVWNHATEVLDVCEQAVNGTESNRRKAMYRANRGLARALKANTAGAVEDFQASVEVILGEDIFDPLQWIQALEKGKNPFTPEVLEELRNSPYEFWYGTSGDTIEDF